jgi:hypothetical protein
MSLILSATYKPFILSVFVLNVMLSFAYAQCHIIALYYECFMLNAIMLNAIMLNAIMLSIIMFSVIMLSVIMESVIMLSVVAPIFNFLQNKLN